MILEFKCRKCGGTYVGEDENDTTHAIDDLGEECGGSGWLCAMYPQTALESESLGLLNDFPSTPTKGIDL